MGLLRVHDLVLVSWGPMGAEYWLVDSLTSSALLQEAARHIPLERLPEYRERYELISVTVPIRNMPLDRAQSCVQRLQRQGQGARMVPFRATNSLLITDLGPCAVSLVELIQAMDDDSGMPALPEPKACDPGRTRR
jgi:hypothetical protein